MSHGLTSGDVSAENHLTDQNLVRSAYRLTADLAHPNAAIYWIDLLASALAGYGALYYAFLSGVTWTGAAIVALLALYRSISFMHELVHLRRNSPPLLWTAWHALVGVPMLVPLFLYDGVHNLHHSKMHFGTAGDPEYLPLASSGPRSIALMLPFAAVRPLLLVPRFLLITPLAALIPPLRPYLVERMSAIMINPAFRRRDPPQDRQAWLAVEALCAVYAWCMVALIATEIVPVAAAALALAVYSGIGVLNMLRTLVAHHYESDGLPVDIAGQLLDSVNVPPPALLPTLWAPVGLRYHALHHLLPNLPYHNLGVAHRRLVANLPANSGYNGTNNTRASRVMRRLIRTAAQARNVRPPAKPADEPLAEINAGRAAAN